LAQQPSPSPKRENIVEKKVFESGLEENGNLLFIFTI
jgi:hypothetical protein